MAKSLPRRRFIAGLVAGAHGGDGCGPAQYGGEGSIWSPDGRYLAYWYQSCQVGSGLPPGANSADPWGKVIISDPEGNVVASFPGQGWHIAWSPDSMRVAVWVSWSETIGVYGIDGERQTVLTLPPGMMAPGDHDPGWSPDGASLLVPNGVEIPLDGSAPRKLPSDDPRSGTRRTRPMDRASPTSPTGPSSLPRRWFPRSGGGGRASATGPPMVAKRSSDRLHRGDTEYVIELRVIELAIWTVMSLAG